MEKIELSTHSNSQCGGTSAYVELVQDSTSCKTKDKGEFDKGTTLVWTASTLDTCLGKEFDVLNDEIRFETVPSVINSGETLPCFQVIWEHTYFLD